MKISPFCVFGFFDEAQKQPVLLVFGVVKCMLDFAVIIIVIYSG